MPTRPRRKRAPPATAEPQRRHTCAAPRRRRPGCRPRSATRCEQRRSPRYGAAAPRQSPSPARRSRPARIAATSSGPPSVPPPRRLRPGRRRARMSTGTPLAMAQHRQAKPSYSDGRAKPAPGVDRRQTRLVQVAQATHLAAGFQRFQCLAQRCVQPAACAGQRQRGRRAARRGQAGSLYQAHQVLTCGSSVATASR